MAHYDPNFGTVVMIGINYQKLLGKDRQWVMRIATKLMQCCQHLLTRNPKIYEENPGKCIGLMGIDS